MKLKAGDRVCGLHTRRGKLGTVTDVHATTMTYGGCYWIKVKWDDRSEIDTCLDNQVIKLT